MERPNRVFGKVLHTLQCNLDVTICSGAIVGPILVAFQLYGERGGERWRERGEREGGRDSERAGERERLITQ